MVSSSAERVRRYRERHKSVTEVTVTDGSVTPVTSGVQPVTLSDGQVWHPDPLYAPKEHPSVVQMGELRGDLKARRARAKRYEEWLREGKPVTGEMVTIDTVVELPEELKGG